MPHSTFLMHDGFSWGGDSTAKLQDRLKFETEQMAEVIKQYVISTTKITSKMFDKKYREGSQRGRCSRLHYRSGL